MCIIAPAVNTVEEVRFRTVKTWSSFRKELRSKSSHIWPLRMLENLEKAFSFGSFSYSTYLDRCISAGLPGYTLNRHVDPSAAKK